ncbi:hypothetical protein K8I28_09795 [bacterium]|nr:hypothetical protein [bacterium]
MKLQEKTVRDLMVPIEQYAVVLEDATLLDALHALERTQQLSGDSNHQHRAVLVRGHNGRIIGKIGHLAFLRAVRTTREQFAANSQLDRAGVHEEMMQASERAYRLVSQDVCDLCSQARTIHVRQAMHPVSERIDVNASLLDALDAFDRWQTLSLLVIRNDRAVGLLRLVELFDEVASIMKRCAEEGGS